MEEAVRTVRSPLRERILATLEASSIEELGVDEKVDALELLLCEHPGACDLPLRHVFTPGLYVREISAPAGVLATTYIHKTEHPYVLSAGEVTVFDGESARRVRAPFFGVTKAGTRRVIFVHRDAVWTTFHPNPENVTDIEALEEEMFSFRTLPDGSNVRDRFADALAGRALREKTA